MELFKLFGTIAIDNSEANKGIDETTDKAEKAYPKISAAFEKIGTAAVKVGKVVATGLGVGAAAIGALAKQSLDSYADYEQLVGGVETLFKESEGKVLEYANNAFRTAGMSANEYMETVTSFSASLLQGLDGDTEKAAEVANRAITDMSDNANKMGTDISMIQNAYQGFAKQNYTMLDNLKLGYGGTQSEMARLINDSGVLGDSMVVTAETVNQVSFDKIIEAIGVIQDEIGITGTTAKEASSTIQGSLSATKSAWQNLLTGFADGNQDLGLLIGNLVESATTAANNIVPRIVQILSGISDALPQIMTVISAQLPVLMESLLPGVISGATSLMTGLITMLPQILQILIEQIPFIISQIAAALVVAFPVLLQTVQDLFGQIWNYIAVGLLGTESDFESSFGKIKEFFEGLWAGLQEIWNTIGQPIFDLIQDCIGIVRDAFAERMPEIQAFVQQCFGDIQEFWNNNLKPCLEAIGNFIKNTLAPIFKDVFESRIKDAVSNAFNFIKDIWNNVLKPIFTGITDFLTGVFTGNWKKAFEGLLSIVKGIFNGIISGIEKMINGAIGAINGIISGINKIISKAGSVLGLNVSIPTISKLSLPRMEEGGILEKGQVGLLEGNGAEAVVPLDQNRAWISAVARDMKAAGIGGQSEVLVNYMQQLIDMLADYFPQLLVAAGHDIVTNDGAILAHYGPLMNAELGRISTRKDRGR